MQRGCVPVQTLCTARSTPPPCCAQTGARVCLTCALVCVGSATKMGRRGQMALPQDVAREFGCLVATRPEKPEENCQAPAGAQGRVRQGKITCSGKTEGKKKEKDLVCLLNIAPILYLMLTWFWLPFSLDTGWVRAKCGVHTLCQGTCHAEARYGLRTGSIWLLAWARKKVPGPMHSKSECATSPWSMKIRDGSSIIQ